MMAGGNEEVFLGGFAVKFFFELSDAWYEISW